MSFALLAGNNDDLLNVSVKRWTLKNNVPAETVNLRCP